MPAWRTMALALGWLAVSTAVAPTTRGAETMASYRRGEERNSFPQPVTRIDLRLSSTERGAERVEVRYHQGPRVFGFIAEGAGVRAVISGRPPERLDRYVLITGRGEALEFRSSSGGGALAPYSFALQPGALLPDCLDERGAFRDSTRFLGERFVREESPPGGAPDPAPAPPVRTLELRDDLLVGASRNFRDVDGGRIPQSRFRDDREGKLDYRYRPFDAADLGRMLEAGFNYFPAVLPAQLEVLYDRPAFFDLEGFAAGSGRPVFPEVFFHPGFQGVEGFIDEPAWLFWSNSDCLRVADDLESMGRRQEQVTREVFERRREGRAEGLTARLARVGIVLDGVELAEPPLPIWEEFYDTGCYQLRVPNAGFIHEGRYRHPRTVDLLNRTFRTSLPRRPETVLRFHYAFLRGAARVFDTDWGTAIYGQADPEISLQALTMAYDRGARYLWFWSSDRDHHLPFEEQLALARGLSAHARTHPRGERRALVRGATDAIVLPYGFTFPVSDWDGTKVADLWHREVFSLREGRTADGVAYYGVLRAAAEQMEELIAAGREFDAVVEVPELESAGYARLHRVLETARARDYRYPWWIDKRGHIAIAALVAFWIGYRVLRARRAGRRAAGGGGSGSPSAAADKSDS